VTINRKQELEAFAFAEYGKLLMSCLTVCRLFDAAGLSYPEPLRRLAHNLPREESNEKDPTHGS